MAFGCLSKTPERKLGQTLERFISLNICIYGAGAVGGSIAARLAAAGENVSVLARGAQLEAIRERGLTVLAGPARIEARVRCANDPAQLGPQDLVVVTLKGHQLPAIAEPLGHMVQAGAYVVFAMNGLLWWFADGLPGTLGLRMPKAFTDSLDPGGALRRCIPADCIIGAVVQSANEVVEPGVILNTSPQRNRLVFGAAFGASAQAVKGIAQTFARAGYEAPVTPHIRQEVWRKLVLYLGVSPVAALTHCALDQLVRDPAAHALMASLMHETMTIGAQLGFESTSDVAQQLASFHDQPTRPSLLQDFERGREPELAGSILAVAAIATALGFRAPCIETVATLVRLKAGARRGRKRLD